MLSTNVSPVPNNQLIHFPKAEFINGTLCFAQEEDYLLALREGVFFVKIPDEINVEPGIKFSQNFYKTKEDHADQNYQGFEQLSYNDSILGYSDRPDQVEQVQLELMLWPNYFPDALTLMLNQMNAFGLAIIENIFGKLGILPQYWNSITGGASKKTGLQYCIFNHYRSHVQKIGITAHKDSGFITVLYSPEPGLEALVGDEWVPITPEDGYFTINLGHSFEVLTQKLDISVMAVNHHVKQIAKAPGEPDRYSFGTYIGPRFDMDLYQYNKTSDALDFYQTFLEFQQIKARQMGYEFHPKVKVS